MRLNSSIFKSIVASDSFDHLETGIKTEKDVELDGRENPVSPEAESAHEKFAAEGDKPYTEQYQQIINQLHDAWDSEQSIGEFVNSLPSDLQRIALAIAKLNYQVHNGGFQQWIDNGYAGNGQGDLLHYELPSTGTLGKVKNILGDVLATIAGDSEEEPSFDDAQSKMEEAYKQGEDAYALWEKFIEDTDFGYSLKNNFNYITVDTDGYPGSAFDVEFEIQGHNYSGDLHHIKQELEDNLASASEEDADELDSYAEEVDMLIEAEDAWGAFEYEGAINDLQNGLDVYDKLYYEATDNQEEYFKEVVHFLESYGATVASLKESFKVGCVVRLANHKTFRVTAASVTPNDIKIQARYLDGTTAILNKKQLATIARTLSSPVNKQASQMFISYNKDFDIYVKTAIKEAGLPVDEDMNWSAYLERIYKNISKDDDIRDEVAHHMIIYHLYQLKTLAKFDTTKAPDKDNPLAKQVTTFLKKMFSFSVSKARDWVADNYGYGKLEKEQEIDPETGETKTVTKNKNREEQAEVGTGDSTFSLLDEQPTEDDYSEFMSSGELKELKSQFYPWLNKTMGKKVGPNLAILFDLLTSIEDKDDVWTAFEEKTNKSFSYYKKALNNLKDCLRKFVSEGKANKDNSLVRAITEHLSKLQKEEKPELVTTSSLKENKMSKLAEMIKAKKMAAQAAKTAKANKFATLVRIAEENPEDVAEAFAELRDKFMEQVEALDALAENLDITPEVAADSEKFASALKRIANEEPEEMASALSELYENLDVLASGIENLADNLGVELEAETEEKTEE